MKSSHIYIFFVGLLLNPFVCSSQELSSSSQALKNEFPDTYEAIKEFALSKWDEDHSMILYEINKQSDAFIKVFEYAGDNKRIFVNAVEKWGENVTPDNMLRNSTVDWNMVLYEMNKQIEAKNSY